LSTSNKPKPLVASEAKSTTPPNATAEREHTDYPRPAPPNDNLAHVPQHVHDDHEELPKKDKKHGFGLEHERKGQENLYIKQEQNRPTRDLMNMGKNTGGKINQPAGKTIDV